MFLSCLSCIPTPPPLTEVKMQLNWKFSDASQENFYQIFYENEFKKQTPAQDHLQQNARKIQNIENLILTNQWYLENPFDSEKNNKPLWSEIIYTYDSHSSKFELSPLLGVFLIQEAQKKSTESIETRALARFNSPDSMEIERTLSKEKADSWDDWEKI